MHTIILAALIGYVGAASCPPLTLDWGDYEGDLIGDNVCQYQNVRFASSPTGSLRFNAPEYPPKSADPRVTGNVGCIAMQTKNVSCVVPPGFDNPNIPDEGDPQDYYPGDELQQQEDCLFLDIYTPASIAADTSLPVIVWFYGGAYLFGSKVAANFSQLPLYDGQGIVGRVASEPAIFVVGNYRLGAFGWLAGDYMEATAGLQPNAGLLDQRAILSFVRDNIANLQGDPTRVSVWGESAGASSILHHIVMPKNIETPLFHNAALQSPAYQWLWDRKGSLNNTFTQYAAKVAAAEGCSSADVKCLQSASVASVAGANQDLFQRVACNGIMPIGPSVDGDLVPDLAVNLINKGSITKLGSILVSHANLEVPIPSANLSKPSFIPRNIREAPKDPAQFDAFLLNYADGNAYAPVRTSIDQFYPSNKYKNQVVRAQQVIMDSSFLCHTRFLISAYLAASTKTFALDYSFGSAVKAATHGSDLVPLFWHSPVDLTPLLVQLGISQQIASTVNLSLTTKVAPQMQTYFVNQAARDDPGTVEAQPWPQASIGKCGLLSKQTCVQSVMRPIYALIGGAWGIEKIDKQTKSDKCEYWSGIASQISAIAGKSDAQKDGTTAAADIYDGFQHVLNFEL